MDKDVKYFIDIVTNLNLPKRLKESALWHIRRLEQKDGRKYYGNYNGASRNPSEMARVEEENSEAGNL